jgi:hypothetical protein
MGKGADVNDAASNSVMILGRLAPDLRRKCCIVCKHEVVKMAQQQIPCTGCCSAIKALMEKSLNSTGDRLLTSLLEDAGNGKLILREQYMHDAGKSGKIFRMFDLNTWQKEQRSHGKNGSHGKSRKGAQRCNFHVMSPHLDDSDWEQRWSSLPQDSQEVVLDVKTSELWSAIEIYFRKQRFCQDCRRNVVDSFGILAGEMSPAELLIDEGVQYAPSLFPSFVPCFVPSFLPLFLPSFLYSFLPLFLCSFLCTLLPFFPSSTSSLPSFLHVPSFLPSFSFLHFSFSFRPSRYCEHYFETLMGDNQDPPVQRDVISVPRV